MTEVAAVEFGAILRPGDTVTWGQAGAEPLPLTRALMAQRHDIGGRFRVFLGVSYSDTVQPAHADCVDFSAYCGTGQNRVLAAAGLLDILPCHYSQLARILGSRSFPVDVLLLQLAPPDAFGRYSLSIAHEYLIGLVDVARVVVAEVNDQAPWTFGERCLTADDLDVVVHTSRPPLEAPVRTPGDTEWAIARLVAELIPDGATLQFGLGSVADAVLAELAGKHDLGVHSGLIGDRVADLMQAGTITNGRKTIDPGVTVAGIMMGGRRILEFAHDNQAVQFRSSEYTHGPDVLSSIDNFVALNSAVEVDLTGQVNAEVAGGTYVGAVGGAVDFLRGAARSKGGLPIVALPATAGRVSRIVSRLSGPVSTPRSDAGIVVTEYGAADLRGLPVSARVRCMLAIAHPDFRERLEGEVVST